LPLMLRAGLLAIAALVLPSASFAQSDDERDLIEALEKQVLTLESGDGPNSADLIAPLTALSEFYEEAGESVLSAAAVQRALEIVRVNYGLYTLEQAALLRRLIARAESLGDYFAAWDLEQSLLRLAERNPEDIRTAGILRDTADRRMKVLERYNAGGLPVEVILGCYYMEIVPTRRVDSNGLPINARGTTEDSCTSGSRRRVNQRIVSEAQRYYSQAVNILLLNEDYSSNELPTLLMELVHSSYSYSIPALGKRSLRYLLAYQTTTSAPLTDRFDTLVQMADWELLHSDGSRGRESALTAYAKALRLLEETPPARRAIERAFSPEIPIRLPAFYPNPLVTREQGSAGYIDVTFVVDKYGRSRKIQLLDATANATALAGKRLTQTIRRSRFRPQLVDGQFADTDPIVVRYHFGHK
jgi:hypothetical protein